jgi:hypothetical protein
LHYRTRYGSTRRRTVTPEGNQNIKIMPNSGQCNFARATFLSKLVSGDSPPGSYGVVACSKLVLRCSAGSLRRLARYPVSLVRDRFELRLRVPARDINPRPPLLLFLLPSLSYTTQLSPMLTFHSENITAAISTFRPDGEVPVLNEQHWDGGQCRIFKVDFANGESWSVRIPIHVHSDSQDSIIGVLQG